MARTAISRSVTTPTSRLPLLLSTTGRQPQSFCSIILAATSMVSSGEQHAGFAVMISRIFTLVLLLEIHLVFGEAIAGKMPHPTHHQSPPERPPVVPAAPTLRSPPNHRPNAIDASPAMVSSGPVPSPSLCPAFPRACRLRRVHRTKKPPPVRSQT